MANILDSKDEEWLAAEAHLHAAMRLPAGQERVEALKLAGKQRWLASEKLIERDERHGQ